VRLAALARSRLRVARRDWLGAPGPRGWARHPGFALLLAGALAAFIHSGLAQGFAALDAAGADATARTGLLALALSGALLALLAFDVDDVVRSLLLDPDLELLRRAPLRPGMVLALKALDAAPRTVLPLLVLAVPALTAFLAGVAAPGAAALVAGVALFTLWLTALAAGVALSLALLRLVPAARARESLALVSTLVLTLLWIGGALLLPRALAPGSGSPGALVPTLEAMEAGGGPAAAAARAVASAGAGEWRALPPDLLSLAAFALAALLALALAGRFALETVLERVTGGRASGPAEGAASAVRDGRWRAPGAVGAIFRRDARMLGRSWTLIGDLLVASVLWGLLPLAGLLGGGIERAELVRLVLLSLSVGLGYEVAARAIPFERHAGHWARVAPVPAIRYVAGKLAGATAISIPIVLAVATVLVVAGAAEGVRPGPLAGLIVGALALSQATGLWAGAAFGDPLWVNPRAMLRFAGRVIASVLVLVQLVGWLGVAMLLELAGESRPWLDAGWLPVLIGGLLAILPIRAAGARLGSPDSRH